MSHVEFTQEDYERNSLAKKGTLASALSSKLEETEDSEFEKIVVFDFRDNIIAACDSLSDLPPVESSAFFKAWSENYVWYSHGGPSMSNTPKKLARNPIEVDEHESRGITTVEEW